MKTLQLFILLFSSVSLVAQGLNLDEVVPDDAVKLTMDRSGRLPKAASLKPFAPITMMQHGSTCAAYSLATALTIKDAIIYSLTDQDEINAHYYSPHFIYYNNRMDGDNSCEGGLDLYKTLGTMSLTGVPRLAFVEYPNHYPFTENALCAEYPPAIDEDILDAQANKIDGFYVLKNLQEIKYAIASAMPIVFGMKVNQDFADSFGEDVWIPSDSYEIQTAYGHAMVMLAYDDTKYGGAVQILNSWGAEWGNGGYLWVRYKDLFSYLTTHCFAIEKSPLRKVEMFDVSVSTKVNLDEMEKVQTSSTIENWNTSKSGMETFLKKKK